ncbi:MAG: methyltransferase domain-containing protein [Patescibacteria group bacterium]
MEDKIKNKLLKIVKDSYEEIADDFSATRNYVWPELKKIIYNVIARRNPQRQPRVAKSFSDGASNPEVHGEDNEIAALARNDRINILDLGCGNGRLAELFTDSNVSYVGVEQSAKLANLARQKLIELKMIGDIVTGDILNLVNLGFKTQTNVRFDLILCIAVLPHLPASELRLKFLRQLKNNLAPDGVFILTVWNLRARLKYKKMIWKHNFKKLFGLNKFDFGDIVFPGFKQSSPRYYHAFRKNELRSLLLQSGFKIHEFYADKHNIYAVCGL